MLGRRTSSALIDMSTPTTSPFEGIVFTQDWKSNKAISIDNGTTMIITGTFSAAGSAINSAGGASASQFGSQMIAKIMSITYNAEIRLNWSSSNVARGKALSLVE